jgi:hypothetical protein
MGSRKSRIFFVSALFRLDVVRASISTKPSLNRASPKIYASATVSIGTDSGDMPDQSPFQDSYSTAVKMVKSAGVRRWQT